jgi:hypothetical protein
MLHTRRTALRLTAIAAVAAAGLVMTSATGVTADSRWGESKQEKKWTQTGIGANVTQDDGSILLVASVENSIDGPGATVSEITLDGNTGTGTATRYTANGVAKGEEEFTLGTPDADGTIPFNGTGKCVSGGTRAFKNAKCTYTFSGTLDPTTNVVTFDITGTNR